MQLDVCEIRDQATFLAVAGAYLSDDVVRIWADLLSIALLGATAWHGIQQLPASTL
jgi:hypothetical protein